MAKRLKWLIGTIAVIAVVGVIGWVFRFQILLTIFPAVVALRDPLTPIEPITWQQGPDVAAVATDDRPPNVVVFFIDDLGWNDITLNGGLADGTVPTPNIDSIAQDGVMFTNAYAGASTCAPSRAALLSGRYPTRFGFEFTPAPDGAVPILLGVSKMVFQENAVQNQAIEGDLTRLPFAETGMPAEQITIAELMQGQGYHTVHMGKWHVGLANGMDPLSQGFDESLLFEGGKYLPEDDPNVVNAVLERDPIDRFAWAGLNAGIVFNNGPRMRLDTYLTDYMSQEAVNVIEANRNRPFFLYMAHWAPHLPLQATQADYDALPHIENHVERTYGAMLLALDRGVGQVLDALEEQGIADNTLIVFASDNGAPYSLGVDDLNAPYRGWKQTLFEGGIHIPMFMRWTNQIPAGITYEERVHHFDIFGTVVSAGGAEIPTDRVMDGVDLIPYVLGDANGQPHDALYWVQGHYRAIIHDDWKYHTNGVGEQQQEWLFNLADDPIEQNNLINDFPERAAELAAMLEAHANEQAEPLWDSQFDYAMPIDLTVDEIITLEDEYVYFPN